MGKKICAIALLGVLTVQAAHGAAISLETSFLGPVSSYKEYLQFRDSALLPYMSIVNDFRNHSFFQNESCFTRTQAQDGKTFWGEKCCFSIRQTQNGRSDGQPVPQAEQIRLKEEFVSTLTAFLDRISGHGYVYSVEEHACPQE